MSLSDRLLSIYDAFSRRQALRGKAYAPYKIDETVRRRILLLIRDVFSGRWNWPGDHTQEFWEQVHNVLEHLYGTFKLSRNPNNQTPIDDSIGFVLESEPDQFFDFLEAMFKANCVSRMLFRPNDLVDALNLILRSDEVPFQLTPVVTRQKPLPNGGYSISTIALPKVVRVDDNVAHTEAILPALSVLADVDYGGANDEFRKALDDYRKGDTADCVAKCGSAFESVLKVLCQKNHIGFDPNKDVGARLLDRLLPRSTLDVATFKEPLIAVARMRNRLSSSHGGGSAVRVVDRHVAQYALTSTAAAIVLCVHDMGK